ncbi:MAG: SDR family NAD(P)-dependent oxidoreductase [Anaerolineae bacterium]|nr:SDR family oxidoreductase [Anaerolineales bacterium]MCQ3972792.1 SDR family NAD(P)-dependent oxidoreductase [Anaerolineae bacterium]
MKRVAGKVALVTGAARGIGRGVALCLAEEGAEVVVNDLPPAGEFDARDTAAAIEALGRQTLVQYADVSDREQVTAMIAASVAHFGRLDIVVANAAVTVRELTVEAQWQHVLRTLEVTQFGVYHTCQMAAQQMVAQAQQGRPGGKIIIIGSVLAEIPLPTSAPYNMAKAAVNQLGRTLAAELAEYRINVNVINPGWIDTPGERQLASGAELQAGAKMIPWGRLGTPRDIGRAAVFLASDEADYITGSSLRVDGGFSLK